MNPSEEELKKKLTPEQYHILREKGTEAPFSGQYVHTKDKGMYNCAACGAQLFSSDAKFDSGTGWPSFDQALDGAVKFSEDYSHGMTRTEVTCANCGSHLGHVFEDLPRHKGSKAGGPDTTGKRYCINSACLLLKKSSE